MTNVIRIRRARLAVLIAAVVFISACNSMPSRVTSVDKDNDGVADSVDACLQTALGNPVDKDGCSVFRGTIESVTFEPGKHQLTSGSRDALTKLVTSLNAHPEVVLRLEGHTDNRGSAQQNLALSKRRVMSVTRFLVANGIDGNRLKPIAYGENRPIKSNATPEGRRDNRRIEMSVVTQ